MSGRLPDRGEIWYVDLDPTSGQEQQGTRPVFVLSGKLFNKMGLILICPITQGGNQSRFSGFAVSLIGSGMNTGGIVMCNQVRIIDYHARRAKFIENAPTYITDDVLAKVQTILD